MLCIGWSLDRSKAGYASVVCGACTEDVVATALLPKCAVNKVEETRAIVCQNLNRKQLS